MRRLGGVAARFADSLDEEADTRAFGLLTAAPALASGIRRGRRVRMLCVSNPAGNVIAVMPGQCAKAAVPRACSARGNLVTALVSDWHPSNAWLPRVVVLVGSEMADSAEHPANARSHMTESLGDGAQSTETKALQPAKVPTSSCSKPAGSVMLESWLHLWNAMRPMVVTLAGRSAVASEEQSANAQRPMDLKLPGSSTDFNEVHPANVKLPMVLSCVGKEMEVRATRRTKERSGSATICCASLSRSGTMHSPLLESWYRDCERNLSAASCR